MTDQPHIEASSELRDIERARKALRHAEESIQGPAPSGVFFLASVIRSGEPYTEQVEATVQATADEIERLHALVARAIPALEQRWRSLPGGVAKSRALADLNAARSAGKP